MNELAYISVTLYFEIHDCELFGGENSVGYASKTFGGVKDIATLKDDFIREQIEQTAAMSGVSADKVKLIPKEVYDSHTQDDDDDCCCGDDCCGGCCSNP